MRRPVVILVLALALGCTSADVGTRATPSAGESASPSPPPGAAKPEPDPSPAGELTARIARYWSRSVMPFRFAVMDRLSDPANPLGLAEAERPALDRAARRFLLARDRVAFRVSRLYVVLKFGWPSESPAGQPSRQAQDELMLQTIERVLPVLEARAGKEKARPAALPAELAIDPDSPITESYDESVSDWESEVPADRRALTYEMAMHLEEWSDDLDPGQAARALAELKELQEALRQSVAAQIQMVDLATATPERQEKVRAWAEKLAGRPTVDQDRIIMQLSRMVETYDKSRPKGRNPG